MKDGYVLLCPNAHRDHGLASTLAIAEALRKGSDRLTEKVGGAALQADEKLDESKETLEAGKLALEIQVDTAKDELLQRQAELQARYDMLRAELTDTRLFSTRGARRLLRAFPRMENLRHTGRLSELREKLEKLELGSRNKAA